MGESERKMRVRTRVVGREGKRLRPQEEIDGWREANRINREKEREREKRERERGKEGHELSC